MNLGSTGEDHNVSCGCHISYYGVPLHDIKKRRTFTHGDAVIIMKRMSKWKEE